MLLTEQKLKAGTSSLSKFYTSTHKKGKPDQNAMMEGTKLCSLYKLCMQIILQSSFFSNIKFTSPPCCKHPMAWVHLNLRFCCLCNPLLLREMHLCEPRVVYPHNAILPPSYRILRNGEIITSTVSKGVSLEHEQLQEK